jgi:hypothetical protein
MDDVTKLVDVAIFDRMLSPEDIADIAAWTLDVAKMGPVSKLQAALDGDKEIFSNQPEPGNYAAANLRKG